MVSLEFLGALSALDPRAALLVLPEKLSLPLALLFTLMSLGRLLDLAPRALRWDVKN